MIGLEGGEGMHLSYAEGLGLIIVVGKEWLRVSSCGVSRGRKLSVSRLWQCRPGKENVFPKKQSREERSVYLFILRICYKQINVKALLDDDGLKAYDKCKDN